MCSVLQFQRSRRERRYADHIFIHSDILQNAPFRSQIFKFFLRWQGGIDPPNQNPARTVMRTDASRRCLSAAMVKPHYAGDAYSSLERTMALQT